MSVVIVILASVVPFVIIAQMVYSLQNYRENRTERRSYLRSQIKCYKMHYTQSSKVSLFLNVSLYVLCAALALVSTYITISDFSRVPMIHVLSFAFFAMAIACLFITIPLEVIRYQTQHICITEIGISIRSTVARVCTSSTKMAFTFIWPDGNCINWDQLENIRIVQNTRPSFGIKKLILTKMSLNAWDRAERHTKVISIPGNHPEIEHILRDIREYAPDKMGDQ